MLLPLIMLISVVGVVFMLAVLIVCLFGLLDFVWFCCGYMIVFLLMFVVAGGWF